jgi:hypothetical protein
MNIGSLSRPDVEDMMAHPLFDDQRKELIPYINGVTMLTSKLRCLDLVLPELNEEMLGKGMWSIASMFGLFLPLKGRVAQ